MNATLHLNEAYGNNVHHVIEACFKAFGRALKEAVRIDEKNKSKIDFFKRSFINDCYY